MHQQNTRENTYKRYVDNSGEQLTRGCKRQAAKILWGC